MSEFFTDAKIIYKGYRMPLWFQSQEKFNEKTGDRLRLIVLKEGTGMVDFGGRSNIIVAPALICLNELDEPLLKKSENIEAVALYFHPELINSMFSFEMIRKPPPDIPSSVNQDLIWLQPFINQDEHYNRFLPIGPVTLNRIMQLIEQINKQLSDQPDTSWPCRTRTIFLELLFLIYWVFEKKDAPDNISIPGFANYNSNNIEEIIFYLHTNYRRKITISELTKEFHINRTSLTKKFTEETNTSIMPYLLGIRVQVASLILRDTNLPITEVMERVGFNDITHFGRVFRKYTGISPSEYRQKYYWMG